MVACFPAFSFKSPLNELSEFPFPVPLFFMILCHDIPKKEIGIERRQGRRKSLGHSQNPFSRQREEDFYILTSVNTYILYIYINYII